jgi:HEAT repeat protein
MLHLQLQSDIMVFVSNAPRGATVIFSDAFAGSKRHPLRIAPMRTLPWLVVVCVTLGCGGEPQETQFTVTAGDAVAARIAELENSDSAMRLSAAEALGAMGPPARPAIPRLLEVLDDDDPEVRKAAAWALTRIGASHQALVPFLISKLKDESPETRGTAIIGLGRIGPDAGPAVPLLIELLEDETPLVQRLAAETLGSIGPRAVAAVPALKAALQADPGLRKVAAEALKKIEPDATSTDD